MGHLAPNTAENGRPMSISAPPTEAPVSLRVVVVDDDDQSLSIAALILRDMGLVVRPQHTGVSALKLIEEEGTDLLVTDLMMPQMDGETLLREVRRLRPELPVVVMSGQDSVERAVNLLQMGATDYIAKPLRLVEFRSRILAVIDRLRLREEVEALRRELDEGADLAGPGNAVLGSTPAMLQVWRRLRRVARTIAPVILLGESGTGKEVLARVLHSWSPRSARGFVSVNCGSIPEGLWERELFGHRRGAFTGAQSDQPGLVEAASGGTLFLDEVGEIPPPSQAKLLRFLEDQEFRRLGDTRSQRADVRLVSATNRNLPNLVAAGQFREDLYYRLNVVSVTIPPLRERMADLPELATHLLREASRQFQVDVRAMTPLALERLMRHAWPGNIRELRNKLQQAVAAASGTVLAAEDLDLPDSARTSKPPPVEPLSALRPFRAARDEVVERFEREYLRRLLEQSGGNVSRAAATAGLPRKALARMLTRHDLTSLGHGRRGRPSGAPEAVKVPQ